VAAVETDGRPPDVIVADGSPPSIFVFFFLWYGLLAGFKMKIN
jgi:hypothetical protein